MGGLIKARVIFSGFENSKTSKGKDARKLKTADRVYNCMPEMMELIKFGIEQEIEYTEFPNTHEPDKPSKWINNVDGKQPARKPVPKTENTVPTPTPSPSEYEDFKKGLEETFPGAEVVNTPTEAVLPPQGAPKSNNLGNISKDDLVKQLAGIKAVCDHLIGKLQ